MDISTGSITPQRRMADQWSKYRGLPLPPVEEGRKRRPGLCPKPQKQTRLCPNTPVPSCPSRVHTQRHTAAYTKRQAGRHDAGARSGSLQLPGGDKPALRVTLLASPPPPHLQHLPGLPRDSFCKAVCFQNNLGTPPQILVLFMATGEQSLLVHTGALSDVPGWAGLGVQ